ncbi:HAMP domain-containing sensor histidine kinase [Paenibacillus elgii]|nr:HAMP domain-containing sensor histidine kinase [Paenibacillus elgii]
MMPNLHKWRNRLFGNDLFGKTQFRFTLQYSLLLSLLLFLFIAIVYTLLYILIWNDQEQRLNKLLDKEIHALQGPLYAEVLNKKFDKPGERAFELSGDQAFYYIIDTLGNTVTGTEIQKELRTQVFDLIRTGALSASALEKIELQTYDEPLPHLRKANDRQQRILYMVGSRLLYRDGQLVGTLYAGKNVDFQKHLLQWLPAVLLGVTLLFQTLVVWLSWLMSRQAMIPIRQAYMRQQQFVTDASHELRTPLSVLLASIEALRIEDVPANDSFEQRVLEGIKDEVQRMIRLTGNLLLLARKDSGQAMLHNAWFDLAGVAVQTADRMSLLAAEKQIRLVLEAPDELRVCLDQEKIVQLLVILLENAIKYTTAGGSVKLIVAHKYAPPKGKFVLEVRDTGVGIPEEELPRIFDRFYRVDKSRSRQMGGHGLGLAIAKHIVEECGGTILVESRPGEGSVFKVEMADMLSPSER